MCENIQTADQKPIDTEKIKYLLKDNIHLKNLHVDCQIEPRIPQFLGITGNFGIT